MKYAGKLDIAGKKQIFFTIILYFMIKNGKWFSKKAFLFAKRKLFCGFGKPVTVSTTSTTGSPEKVD